jgi:hypothetical protein
MFGKGLLCDPYPTQGLCVWSGWAQTWGPEVIIEVEQSERLSLSGWTEPPQGRENQLMLTGSLSGQACSNLLRPLPIQGHVGDTCVVCSANRLVSSSETHEPLRYVSYGDWPVTCALSIGPICMVLPTRGPSSCQLPRERWCQWAVSLGLSGALQQAVVGGSNHPTLQDLSLPQDQCPPGTCPWSQSPNTHAVDKGAVSRIEEEIEAPVHFLEVWGRQHQAPWVPMVPGVSVFCSLP